MILAATIGLYAAGVENEVNVRQWTPQWRGTDAALERFYRENDGKAMDRLPSWVEPTPVFLTLANIELKAGGGGVVKFKARGMFAARVADGRLKGFSGGEVTHVEAAGISLSLERPEDVALVELADGWHGVWQTDDTAALVPDALKTLAPHWIKLRSIRRQH